MQLRPYQQQLKADIYQQWDAGARNVAAVLPTGGGKTVVFGSVVHDHGGYSCSIAHRQELVGQISLALARERIRHQIIAPQSVISDIVQTHTRETGQNWSDPTAKAGVAGVQSLLSRRKDPRLAQWFRRVDLWVQDECFTAGTLIDGRPISELKPGESVTAFDEATGEFEQCRIVRLFKNKAPRHMMRIIAGHHVLDCTAGHPFWTKRGWVNAGELRCDDELYELRQADYGNQRAPTVQVQEDRQDLLRSGVRSRAQGQESQTKAKTGTSEGALYDVRKGCRPVEAPVQPMEEHWQSVLRENMQRSVPVEKVIGNDGTNQPEIRIGKDEEQQPDGEPGNQTEGFTDAEGYQSSTENQRRKRQTTNRGGSNAQSPVRGHGVSATDGCENGHRRDGLLPAVLQDRLRSCAAEDSDRSGRQQSLRDQETGTGRQEGCVPVWLRVDSVQILESDDIERSGAGVHDGHVYNIEVEHLHTYVADGIVVHNCHHLLAGNQWGKAAALFPNARGLGVTATPLRADGAGLGRHADGVFDAMVEGPPMRWLIDQGFLTDYRVFAPPPHLIMDDSDIGSTGDYKQHAVTAKFRKAKNQIIGDIVGQYQRIAAGKKGVVFVPDVEDAIDTAAAFNLAGIPAAAVSAKTPDRERLAAVAKLRRGDLQVLVNVDLFGEGFDLPSVEVVSMARPTMSYGLYAQQFGRALRLMDGKDYAIIIDHVGNVQRHGLPDRPRIWTLDRVERGARKERDPDLIPTKSCQGCTAVYEATHAACPYCGHVNQPAGRQTPEQVDGDLIELDPSVLAEMRAEVERIDQSPADLRAWMQRGGAPSVAVNGAVANHRKRQEAQEALRATMAMYGGHQKAAGRDKREAQKRFFWRYGVDVLSAQALGRREAEELTVRIATDLLTLK